MSNTTAVSTDTTIQSVYMIHNLAQGLDARRGFDVWLYLAYSSFVVSIQY